MVSARVVVPILGTACGVPKIGAMRKSTHTAEYRALRGRMAAMRTEAGLSQRDLARRLRVPHTWIAKVESGERRIDLIEFGWFCTACGQNPADSAAALLAGSVVPKGTGGRS
jgi:DNA-binding XRE family transcriptional regulator